MYVHLYFGFSSANIFVLDIREWAIFGLRNLCEGNLENQDVIRSLEARGAADQQTLRELGLESEVGKDGRLKVRSTGSPLARQQNESD